MTLEENKKMNINSYLTFKLRDEIFAANVGKIINILEMVKITKVPKSPVFMKGVINLRGTVLPVIDTRIKFDMGETPITSNTCILVLEIKKDNEMIQVGAIVDTVLEVLEFDKNIIQPVPSIGTKFNVEFLEGMVNMDKEFIMILNIELIFTTEDLDIMKEKAASKKNLAAVNND